MGRERAERAGAMGLILALSIPLFFVKLGGAGLVDPDEPYYAVPALEMLRSGSWLVPVFRGQPWFDKPALFYWIVLASFKTFGVSEWAARLGSALAGLGGALAVVALAPCRWRRGGAHILTGVVLVTSLEYALLSRAAVTDMTLTFLLTAGFLASALYLESPRLPWAAAAGAAFGLAALTKGPVGIALPLVALAGYALLTRRREGIAPRAVAAVATGFAVTGLPWYLYMIAAHRDLVVRVFLGEENLGRFVTPEHRQFPFFYAAVLAVGLLPWSGALPAGLAAAMRAWRRGEERTGSSPGTVFALAWFSAVLLVFGLSASKLSTYVLPAFPAAAFLIADYWRSAFANGRARVFAGPLATASAGGLASAAAAAALVLLGRGALTEAGPALRLAAAVLVIGAVVAIAAVRLGRPVVFVAVQAASSTALVLVAVTVAWPGLEPSESTRTLARRLAGEGLAQQLAGAYRVPDVSLDFYLDRALPRETDARTLVRRVEDDPRRLWVVRASEMSALAALPLNVDPVMTVARRAVVRLTPKEKP